MAGVWLAIGVAIVLVFSILSLSISMAQTSSKIGDEWKTAHTVGKFSYSDPPKPDQIFKIQYRVLNGTIEKLTVAQTKVISSSGNGTLEIKVPRNYPYTNEDGPMAPNYIDALVFVDDKSYDEITYNEITDCFFVFSIPFTGNKSIGLVWDYLLWTGPSHGNEIPDSCIPQTLVENVPTRNDGTITPLQQFKAGVAAEDAVCPVRQQEEEQLMLLISPNQKPYCVNWSNEGFMKRHGWIEPFQK